MLERSTRIAMICCTVLCGASLLQGREQAPPRGEGQDKQAVAYEAEEGIPRDKMAERRRDFAVWEAALNDLASPENPEHRHQIRDSGPGREIVVDDNTCRFGLAVDLGRESRSIDNSDARRVPEGIREDVERRVGRPVRSLAGFKPANPAIIVRDLDRMFEEADDPSEEFREEYPRAWGFVWAYPPGYSEDGTSAVAVFEGGPNGNHGLNWIYMLARRGKRWEVLWRHCHPRE